VCKTTNFACDGKNLVIERMDFNDVAQEISDLMVLSNFFARIG
jgi:hypothetical protein